MILWVHETTLTTKSEAAGFSKGSVSELFSLLERAVEQKVNGIMNYVYNVDESVLITF
jgi:hypothetical protein